MSAELDELMVNLTSLKSDINKLKNVSRNLSHISSINSSLSSSKGSAKEALDKELTSIKNAGLAYKAAIDDLVADLEMAEQRFKSTDERLAGIYRK